jgi:hypothetical protein
MMRPDGDIGVTTRSLAGELVRLATALEPLTGEGRSAAVWSLGPEPTLVYAGPHALPDVIGRATQRLAESGEGFEIEGEPGVLGKVIVLGEDDDVCAYGLFLHGAGHPHLSETVERLISAAEKSIGKPVAKMSRTQKQMVVRFLDDRGAFLIRRAVDAVANRLEVTRFTVYNYLDREDD